MGHYRPQPQQHPLKYLFSSTASSAQEMKRKKRSWWFLWQACEGESQKSLNPSGCVGVRQHTVNVLDTASNKLLSPSQSLDLLNHSAESTLHLV